MKMKILCFCKLKETFMCAPGRFTCVQQKLEMVQLEHPRELFFSFPLSLVGHRRLADLMPPKPAENTHIWAQGTVKNTQHNFMRRKYTVNEWRKA